MKKYYKNKAKHLEKMAYKLYVATFPPTYPWWKISFAMYKYGRAHMSISDWHHLFMPEIMNLLTDNAEIIKKIMTQNLNLVSETILH